MLPEANRYQVARLALAIVIWFFCFPVAAQEYASPAESAQNVDQSARRRPASKTVETTARRHVSARNDGVSGKYPTKAKKARQHLEAAPPIRGRSSDDNNPKGAARSTDKVDAGETAHPEGDQDGLSKSRARASDQELEKIARTFCSNNIANAAEARVAWQIKRLQELESEVTKKSAALSGLIQESRTWAEKREKLLTSTRDNLVEIYAKMKPEVAAQQLATMSEEIAASIIARLNVRSASAIFNEMGSEKAARLADGTMKSVNDRSTRDKGGS